MEHKLKIRVSKEAPADGIIACRNVTLRERFLHYICGEKHRVTVLIPGDSVGEIDICEAKEGGNGNGERETDCRGTKPSGDR